MILPVPIECIGYHSNDSASCIHVHRVYSCFQGTGGPRSNDTIAIVHCESLKSAAN